MEKGLCGSPRDSSKHLRDAYSNSALDTYAAFREAVDSESSFVHRDYRLVLAPGRTSQPAVDSVILLEAALERPRVAALGAKNNKIMFRISCALLVAVANGLYAPQQPRFASRARPLAAAEGGAAAEAKKRIARHQCLRTGSTRAGNAKESRRPKKRATNQCSRPVACRFPPPPNQETRTRGAAKQKKHAGRRRQRHGRPAPRRALRRQARGAGRF